MSTKPSSVPLVRAKKAASALPSMPGVGMCTQIRYTARRMKVDKKPLSQLWNFWNILKTADHLYPLYCTASCDNFSISALAPFVNLKRQRSVDFPLAKKLNAIADFS